MKFVFISHGIPSLATKRICEMVGKSSKDIKVLYITTPANTYPPNPSWLVEAKEDIKKQGFQMTEFDIEKKGGEIVQSFVAAHDVVWVSGGNAFYFLYWAEKVGLKEMLVKFLSRGGVYAGESAGIVCQIKDLEPIKWADHPEKAPQLIREGMQLTDIVAIPHWGDQKYGEVMKKIKVYYEKKGIKPYLLRNGEALIIDGGKIEEIRGGRF